MNGKLLLTISLLIAGAAAQLASADSSTTEKPKYKAGSRVIVIRETPLRVDDHPVKQIEPGTPLRVDEVNDDGFLGVTSGRDGWIDANDVVPIEQGIEPLNQLIAKDSDNIRLRQARAVLASDKKEWDLAIEDLTELMRLEPKQANYYLLRSDAYKAKHDNDKALDDLNEAIQRSENPTYALLKRGFLWSVRKEPDKAMDDFNEALKQDPDEAMKAEILGYRGSVYLDQHDTDKAFADFNEALKLNPRDAANFSMRAAANYELKKYKQAIADYSAALWIEPDSSLIYSHRGYAFLRNGEQAAAKVDFEKAIELDPANSYALTALASLKTAKKDFDGAIADLNKCLTLNPKDIEVLVGRADTYGLMKQYGKQIADYREAIKISPDEAMAHNNLAWILATCPEEKVRNGKEAVEQATKAVELTNNKQGEFVDTLAAAYAEAGDFDKAAECQQKAIDLVQDEKTRKDMRSRLEMFHKHQAYRETPGENAAAGE